MVKEIELQNGMKAIVDDEDYESVNQYNWTVKGNDVNVQVYSNGLYLQRLILEGLIAPEDKIRFKNKNPLDFRKVNLKILKNNNAICFNRSKKGSTSKYKGVSWHKKNKRWVADIRPPGGKTKYLGSFLNEDEAAIAYNNAAKKYFGDAAYLNVLGKDNRTEVVNVPKLTTTQRRKYRRRTDISKYKGVVFLTGQEIWLSQIHVDGERQIIGRYKTEIEAAKAYNEKAKELFGDKAILNDLPEEIPQS